MRRDQVTDATARLVDLVDEDAVRGLEFIETPQQRLEKARTVWIGISDHNRQIDRRKNRVRLAGEIDGARTIENDILIAEIFEAGDVQFRGEAAGTRLLAGVTDRCTL